MRRGTASLIIALSLMVASLSWAGFTLSNTILDPGRSERLATQLLDNPEVREALIDRVADALETQIPPEIPVPRATIETGAAIALDDPRVEALVIDGFVRVHQNALAGNPEPVSIDAGALGAAGRDALINVRPELDRVLPAAPSVTVDLPTTGLSWMGRLKNFVDRYTLLGAAVSLVGLAGAFAVTTNRGSVFRRVAYWGYGAAAFWVALGYGIPRVAELLSPRSAAIASAAIDVFFGAMIRPAVIMAIIATVLLIIGLLWPALSQNRAARVAQPPRRHGTGMPVGSAPVGSAPIKPPTKVASGGVGPSHRTEEMPAVVTHDVADQTPTEWRPGFGYVEDQDRPPNPFDSPADPSATSRLQP